ncbi:MAG: serine/threonine protein kinase [Fibrobacter sp.]|nr:serine/threonine protein kinase [Fibrobacter sp.]
MHSQIDCSKSIFNPASLIGKEIGGYTIIQMLGRGAMGAVFIAFQHSLKRKIAVKIYPKQGPVPDSGIRFRDEAETVAILNHPSIVPVFDMGDTGDLLYISMQLVEGEDLDSIIQRYNRHPVSSKKFIPVDECIRIFENILDALSFAHEEGVIHQDIKPANILIEERGQRPYLADFGIARTEYTEQSQEGVVFGTPIYMSPEQMLNKKVDNRSDIYSAGMSFYETVAGKLPLRVKTIEKILMAKINDHDSLFTCLPSQWRPHIDKELERIVCKAVRADPEKRYQSAAAFRDDLHFYYERRCKKV